MECERCRRERARLHVTLVEAGATLEIRLCEICAPLPETVALLAGTAPPPPIAEDDAR
jgi:protein-arginine kinase activator protein McsA